MMRTIHVEKIIAAPIEDVFGVISDHAGYSRFRNIQHSEVVREGTPAPNGLGALRQIHGWPMRFEEEITAFEPPTRMDYLIRDVNLPLVHEGGSILFSERPGGTYVDWTSTFELTTPVIGGLMTRIGVAVISRGFRRMLADTERLLSGSRVPASAGA